jgi:Rps23 Pro-64 3,4-dihydroxylase Tpa1-like proline 4-hydroxylase
MEQIIAWKNFLTDDERNGLIMECNKYNWSLEGYSQSTPETRTFWFKDLMKSIRIKNLFSYKIEEFLAKKIEISRVYANGQAHGQCGMFHQDIPGCEYSLVYYIHENWKPEYGGHLMIKNGDNIESYWPESNSAILFRSDLWHCPLEPTVYCKTQRESIAFKFSLL